MRESKMCFPWELFFPLLRYFPTSAKQERRVKNKHRHVEKSSGFPTGFFLNKQTNKLTSKQANKVQQTKSKQSQTNKQANYRDAIVHFTELIQCFIYHLGLHTHTMGFHIVHKGEHVHFTLRSVEEDEGTHSSSSSSSTEGGASGTTTTTKNQQQATTSTTNNINNNNNQQHQQ